MPDRASICPGQFIRILSPLLDRRDLHGVVDAIQHNWSMAQVVELLDGDARHPDAKDAQKVAALALSLVGTDRCLAKLAKQLQHADRMVAQMAEHAMWSIWFRSGNEAAKQHFARGSIAFSHRDLAAAKAHFTRAIEADPNFAEAYNQRAIVAYVEEQFDDSLADCERTTALMPLHFGAWAGAGHCHACLGQTPQAIQCYERARQINPHMECVEQLIQELRTS